MAVFSSAPKKTRRKTMALLLPGHNEELIIASTIRSAIRAGQKRHDIYVVDDASTDATRRTALKLLPKSNVLTVERSGKAGAVHKALTHFAIQKRYHWVHIADADSIFCPDYFRMYKYAVRGHKYAAAVGFVQSLRGNWLATYRSFCYTYGQHIFRRVQGWFGMISVMPGPVSAFRTDILSRLDFSTGSVTEDFDLTLQIHRKKLGAILFIPEAINYTQDPKNIRDFSKQTLRWQRGFFQGIRRYGICLQPHRIDISVGFVLLEVVMYFAQLSLFTGFVILHTSTSGLLRNLIIFDTAVLCTLAILAAIAARRLTIIIAPLYYFPLRILELSIFVIAFIEVMVLGKLRAKSVGWDTAQRRYSLDKNALRDTAQ